MAPSLAVPAALLLVAVSAFSTAQTALGQSPTPPAPAPVQTYATGSLGYDCQYSRKGAGILLGSCAQGYAAGVRGGRNKYTVTNATDQPGNAAEGTLRYGVYYSGNYITFARSMDIYLSPTTLPIASNVTIDGRGFKIRLFLAYDRLKGVAGYLYLLKSANVILHNIEIVAVPETKYAILMQGANTVWVDHVKFTNFTSTAISTLQGASLITISNNFFDTSQGPEFILQLGGRWDNRNVGDEETRKVTVYRNYATGFSGGFPDAWNGVAHVANNYFSGWGAYTLDVHRKGCIRSEANIYEATGRSKEVTMLGTSFSDKTTSLTSFNDSLLVGATLTQRGQWNCSIPYVITNMHVADALLQAYVLRNAGPQRTVPPSPPPPNPPRGGFPQDCIWGTAAKTDPTVCAPGYALPMLGGKQAYSYVVNTNKWDPNLRGSLAQAVLLSHAYITFTDNFFIDVGATRFLRLPTFSTLDARGFNITIFCNYVDLQNWADNVIFLNVNFLFKGTSAGLYMAGSIPAKNVWFEHCTFSFDTNPYQQSLVYMGTGASAVTFAHCRFNGKAFYANNTGFGTGYVTLYRNYFNGGGYYQLFSINFFWHAVNNYFADWTGNAVGLSFGSTFLSVNNVFSNSLGKIATVDPWKLAATQGVKGMTPAQVANKGSFYLDGTTIVGDTSKNIPVPKYTLATATANGALQDYLVANSGVTG